MKRAWLWACLAACRPIVVVPPCPSPPATATATPTPTATSTPTATPTPTPTATPTATATSTPTPTPTPPRPAVVAGYRRVWDVHAGGWNHAVAIAPNGDVVVGGGGGLLVLARADGHEVARVPTCSPLSGESIFFKKDVVVVACDTQVVEIELDKQATRAVVTMPSWMDVGRMEAEKRMAAHAGNTLAIADDDGTVELYSTGDWKKVATVKQSGGGAEWRIEGLALWGDHALAASWWDHGTFTMADVNKPAWKTASFGHSGGIAYSPDGKWLFGVMQGFSAGAYRIADGAIRGDAHISSWLTQARFIDADHVVATGAHGLGVISLAASTMDVLDDDAGEGLAVADGGSFICSGGRSDHIVCFSRI